jgi:hypothetical protein
VIGSGFNTGFTSPAEVFFGGVPATVTSRSSTSIYVKVPAQPPLVGTLNVTVCNYNAPAYCTRGSIDSEFTYGPPAGTNTTVANIVSAQPIWVPNGTGGWDEGIIAATSTGEFIYLNSTNGGISFVTSDIAPYNRTNLAEPAFQQVGYTAAWVAGGLPGEVAGAIEGTSIFALVTTYSEGRMVAETVASDNGGTSWGTPYLTGSAAGSISSPEVAVSPAGYFYVTWTENGAGPEEVDQTVFSETGEQILAPAAIAGSGGKGAFPASSPSVAVDGLQRPLYVWNRPNLTGNVSYSTHWQIEAAGAFPFISNALKILSATVNSTIIGDFNLSKGTINLLTFKSTIQSDLNVVRSAVATRPITNTSICTAETDVAKRLFPNLTDIDPIIPFSGPFTCSYTFPTPTKNISPEIGPLTANQFLFIETGWVLEDLGGGGFGDPYWGGAPLTPLNVSIPQGVNTVPAQYSFDTSGKWVGDGSKFGVATINITPLSLNPNSILFAESHPHLPTGSMSQSTGSSGAVSYYDRPIFFNASLTLNNSYHNSTVVATSTSGPPSIYITNLTNNSHGNWSETVNVTYEETETEVIDGGTTYHNVGIFYDWPTGFKFTVRGIWVTNLEWNPTYLNITIANHAYRDANGTTAENDLVAFQTSLAASYYSALNNSSALAQTDRVYNTGPSNLAAYASNHEHTFRDVPVSPHYADTYVQKTQSFNGSGSNSTLRGGLKGVNVSWDWQVAPVETLAQSCSFYEPLNNIGFWGSSTTNITRVNATSALLTWFSNQSGTGWVEYHDFLGANFSAFAQKFYNTSAPNSSFKWEYQIELHGLHPFSFYNATIGVTTTDGTQGACHFSYMAFTSWYFQTQSQVQFTVVQFPYDSITHQGGGATVEWNIPSTFVARSRFVNGSLAFWNRTLTASVPLTSLWTVPAGIAGTPVGSQTYGVNLTSLTLNGTYNLSLILNYNVSVPWSRTPYNFSAGSLPFDFVYEKDSSGDGLTDWEKSNGWEVNYESASGTGYSVWENAVPSLYATNGLTSDYEEKLFGLNPRTVDTAGSHMLDTWNLTFDLGKKYNNTIPSLPAGSNFEIWNETGLYNWNQSCQYFVAVGSCSKGEVSNESAAGRWSNLSGMDSWAWASRVLWSRVALDRFVNFSGVLNASWLRATIGNSSGQWTITVGGKLSWGANPLAASTPGDGVPDGERIDPLYDADLKVSSLSANFLPGQCPSVSGSTTWGWAVLFYLNTTTGVQELPSSGNYSVQATDTSSSCGKISNRVVIFPTVDIAALQQLKLRLVVNEGTTGSPNLVYEPFNDTSGNKTAVTLQYNDVMGGTTATCSMSGHVAA